MEENEEDALPFMDDDEPSKLSSDDEDIDEVEDTWVESSNLKVPFTITKAENYLYDVWKGVSPPLKEEDIVNQWFAVIYWHKKKQSFYWEGKKEIFAGCQWTNRCH